MARVILDSGDDIVVGSDARVYGTAAGAETIRILGGDISLDASFNTGGDTVILPGLSSDYSAQVVGSQVVIANGDVTVRIPVGSEGLDVRFDDDSLTLRYDVEHGVVLLGDQEIGRTLQPIGGGENGNEAPSVARDIPNQTLGEEEAWRYTVPRTVFSDPDGDRLTYTATLSSGRTLPGWLSFDAATRTFSGTPPAEYSDTLRITVTASDGEASASETFRLDIIAGNDVPRVASPIANQGSDEDSPWSYTVPAGTFRDDDGDALTYSAALAGGDPLPAWLGFDADTRTFTGTPPEDFHGDIDIRVVAQDGASSASDTFTLTIGPVADAPVAGNPIDDRSIEEDEEWSFTVPAAAFDDADGDTLTYSATLGNGDPLPAWLSFDAATRTFAGTPPQDYEGAFDLTVSASDGIASVSDTFTLTIEPVNDAPVVDEGVADQTSDEDTAWSFTVPEGAFSDVDSDTLTYTATLSDGDPLPGWLSFDASARTFSGTPPQDFNGTIALTVTASDGEESASDTFTLTIDPVHDAPVVDEGIADQSTDEDAAWSFTVPADAFEDADGGTLSYSASLANGTALPSWLAFNPATLTFTGTPPQGANGEMALTVTASDGTATASDTFTLTINDANDAPALSFDTSGVFAIGGEVQVNSTTSGSQSRPSVAGTADGGYVVTWVSSAGLYSQLYDASGDRIGGEVLVSPGYASDQSVTALDEGGHVVSWIVVGYDAATDDNFYRIYSQRYDAFNNPVGVTILADTKLQGDISPRSVTDLPDGGYLLVWHVWDDATWSSMDLAQRFDAGGGPVGEVRPAQLGESIPKYETSAWLDDGDVGVHTDYSGRDGHEWGVFATFDLWGQPVQEVQVNTYITGRQHNPVIAATGDESVVIVWESRGQDGSDTGLYAQRFSVDFEAVEQETLDLTGVIGITDTDATGDLTMTLSVNYGVLDIDAGTSGAAVTGSGTDEVTVTGTLAELQALLQNDDAGDLSFTPDTDAPPRNAMLSVSIDDGFDITTGSIQIPIVAVPDL